MNTFPKQQLTLTCQVDPYRSGWTVVQFLAHRFKYHTAEGWEQRVRDRWVHVNQSEVEPEHVVNRGDVIHYTIWHAEPPVDDDYTVLFEDEHYLAVAKSGNCPVHACGIYIVNTLIARLRGDFGPRVTLAHRLDRETSGVVMLARNREANRRLARMFERGEVAKTYRAVVFGNVVQTDFVIDAPIGKVDARIQYPVEYAWGKENDLATYLPKRRVDPAGKPARTRVEVTARAERFTSLRLTPEQGRTNQIRVHLAHIGHPLVGDKIYGLAGEIRDEQMREGLTERVRAALVLERHALHGETLDFVHPMTGERLTISAPVPDDMRELLTPSIS
ncbi:MAG: RluA family pseudouridine synthase [Candidatus Krumholzibacteria bacterium]|nr:RluA family pseudouridine synthase [Candidatus Krumholzibacteria bacterium]MDH5269186.1 RluA family pseudouridine synthase [Candidatus Krumholzibacteria bacterium]